MLWGNARISKLDSFEMCVPRTLKMLNLELRNFDVLNFCTFELMHLDTVHPNTWTFETLKLKTTKF